MYGTGINTIALIVCGIIAISAIFLNIHLVRRVVLFRQIAADQHAICEAWETEFSKIRGISHNFLNACRLLSIHRNGRVNVFTFARCEQIFTIETVGILSDQPDEWRKLAGLDK